MSGRLTYRRNPVIGLSVPLLLAMIVRN